MLCTYLGFCKLNPAEQAAWVQAIGSIIALIVAVALPLFLDWKRRRERDDGDRYIADELAFDIQSDVEEWHGRALDLLANLAGSKTNEQYAFFIGQGGFIDKSLADRISQLRTLGPHGRILFEAMMISRRLSLCARQLSNPANFGLSAKETLDVRSRVIRLAKAMERKLKVVLENLEKRLDDFI